MFECYNKKFLDIVFNVKECDKIIYYIFVGDSDILFQSFVLDCKF